MKSTSPCMDVLERDTYGWNIMLPMKVIDDSDVELRSRQLVTFKYLPLRETRIENAQLVTYTLRI